MRGTLGDCRRRIAFAEKTRHSYPRRALELALDARDACAILDRTTLEEAEWLDLQARCWGVLGSALRAVADLRGAEEALNIAAAFLKAPALDERRLPGHRADLLRRAAYLRRDQERFAEALELIDAARAGFAALGDHRGAAGAQADRGAILGRAGRRREAVEQLRAVVGHFDPEIDRRDYLAVIQNLALNLFELAEDQEQLKEALAWSRLAAGVHQQAGSEDSLSLLKIRGVEAALIARLGQLEPAIALLWQVQGGLGCLGARYEQSSVLLHLAGLYLERGNRHGIQRVAGELFPIFRGFEVNREANAALQTFYRAALAETVSSELVARVSEQVRQARSHGTRTRALSISLRG